MKINKITKKILLKDGLINDPFKEKKFKGSILIENGFISKISNEISDEDCEVFDCKNLIITHGFCDIHAHFREPGDEDMETLESGAFSAMSGGYTEVCVMPNTNPTIDSPETIKFIIDKSKKLPVSIFPIGAITLGQKGKELTEFYEMNKTGAIAFSDDGIPVTNSNVMRIALEYSKPLGVPIINHSEDLFLKNEGQLNEGILSTKLGLKGNPDISESIMINRDLEIAAFTKGKLHIPHVSCKKSVDWIRLAKSNDEINISAEVTPHHLAFDDTNIIPFDTNFKVAPPIRTFKDRKALIEGLIDGTIDCIATDHAPHSIEKKTNPFEFAPPGMIGLESSFGVINKILSVEKLPIEKIIKLLTNNPRKIMKLNQDLFKIGTLAQITILDKDEEWTFNKDFIFSKSHNSPFINNKLIGKIKSVISKSFIFRR